jgi:hypothetical protein
VFEREREREREKIRFIMKTRVKLINLNKHRVCAFSPGHYLTTFALFVLQQACPSFGMQSYMYVDLYFTFLKFTYNFVTFCVPFMNFLNE